MMRGRILPLSLAVGFFLALVFSGALLIPPLSAQAIMGQGAIGQSNQPLSGQDRDQPEDGVKTITIARAMDKVTARITELELPEDEPVEFGSLIITSRHCQSRPPEEQPETFAFLEIDEMIDDNRNRLFTGWMMASSPGLHALEHPVYDVWVMACKTLSPDNPSGSE
ncbi:putative protein [alpha proteobacterium Q-1]|nr:putative protein [alpha proteobacterium Q-1]